MSGNAGSLIAGGGIAQEDDGAGPSTINLNRAVVSGHSVDVAAAGVLLDGDGANSFTNVTVSGNEVTNGSGEGGGIILVGSGSLDLRYSTVANNTASDGGGVQNMDTSTVTSTASLISDNAGGDCLTYDSGVRISNDFNVVGDSTCGFGQPNDVNNAGPMLGTTLGPLADNGGWNGVMLTHALLTGNPAIDHADSPSCPGLDERGHVRPVGAACDTGAYEAAETPPPDPDYELTIDKTLVGAAKAGGEAHWHITISNTGTDPAPGRLTFADTLPDAVSFTSVAAPDWDCSNKGQTVTCFYDGDLDPGVVTKLDIVAAIDGEPGSDITNTAGVSTFGSVDPTFSTAPGEVSTPSVPVIPDPDDPSGGKPSGDATGEPPGTLPFTGFHLTEVALAAAAAVALGATITWRNRRRARA
ncbi:MAG: hypothetical protein M5U31_02635 [Acidimicrobiia bacterium]|nr:hypothetical protein [Acidimicrobiia bacterium]